MTHDEKVKLAKEAIRDAIKQLPARLVSEPMFTVFSFNWRRTY